MELFTARLFTIAATSALNNPHAGIFGVTTKLSAGQNAGLI
ncbi:hypothetical protein HMPREF0454_01124 [Hafnia alvei ATCC 51873]|jgi:hypothetical protein|uniref:Uncharacterized protein n=1 Tax=Hafnia alvei ATCC 51873 TaxID=1002364 RepID=G9Y3C2_HAFAL|nr:hypothetical protein HMPREF0454_01124 [Hafnia alvei ATCC 51873]